MVTGASTADVAVILLDARKGVVEQTRRHSYIAAILAIPHVVVAVNKMDLVDFSAERFAEIEADLQALSGRLGLRDERAIPMSALRGDNVVDRGDAMPWYDGPTLLEHLESIELAGDRNLARPALPRAVGDPADGRRAPRLPRLRRPGRRRHLARRRRGRRAARAVAGAASPPSRRSTASSTRRSRRSRSRSASKTTSTSAAATCSPTPTGRRSSRRELDRELCWMSERPLEPRREARRSSTRRAPSGPSSRSSSRSSTCTRSRIGPRPSASS